MGEPASALPPLLTGRRALVTGAARGIGAAVADAFSNAGAHVTRLDVAVGWGIIGCDVTNESEVEAAFAAAAADGPITDVVHAAGTVSLSAVADTGLESFRRTIDVNLVGSFIVAREAARRLGPGGNLILVASQAGLKGGALWGAYSASKGGVLRLADCLTEELSPKGIRVNCISPGSVDTAMIDNAIEDLARRKGSTAKTMRAAYEASIPMGRFARPEEVGNAAVALCSSLMSYANGANIVLDGGELSR